MTATDQRAIALNLYLQYVYNTSGNATVADFDDDWSPIGPMLRGELMPKYIAENDAKKLVLTVDGERIRAKAADGSK